ncbi:MAG: NAD(P)-dependent oxidoreductase [Haloarculaceae archaeon]
MPSALVTHSETHPVRIERFRRRLGHPVETLELPPGGLESNAEVDRRLAEALADHDALFLRPGRVTRELLDATDLDVVAVHGSGYDHVDVEAATEAGVVVTHNPEGPGPAVVEHTLGFAVALLREFAARDDAVGRGDWSAARHEVTELGRTTVGVVGQGTIGFEVARRMREFGAEVLACDPYVTGERTSNIYPRVSRQQVEDEGVELVARDDLFERADLVTVHTPLTDDTRGLVGAAELDALGAGYLVNTSRGPVVDEDALYAAVTDGQLRGAALDVMREEPPAPDNPLLGLDDVLITPHVAGVSEGYLERAADLAAEKVGAVFAGERPERMVNPEVWGGD